MNLDGSQMEQVVSTSEVRGGEAWGPLGLGAQGGRRPGVPEASPADDGCCHGVAGPVDHKACEWSRSGEGDRSPGHKQVRTGEAEPGLCPQRGFLELLLGAGPP